MGGPAHGAELHRLGEIGHGQNARHDRRGDARREAAVEEPQIDGAVEEGLGDRPRRAGIELALEIVEIVLRARRAGMHLRIGGDADLEIRHAPQALDQFGGALVAIRADIRLTGRQIAAKGHDMADAALPVAGRDLADLGAAGPQARQMGGRHQGSFAHETDHGCVCSLSRAAAGAVGYRNESGAQRLQPADAGPELRLQRLGLRREELEGECRRRAAARGQRQGAEARTAHPTFKNRALECGDSGRRRMVHDVWLNLRLRLWRRRGGMCEGAREGAGRPVGVIGQSSVAATHASCKTAIGRSAPDNGDALPSEETGPR